MKIEVKEVLESVGVNVSTKAGDLTWTQDEHCYTMYEDTIFDSEGELPDYVQNNLGAIKEYFGTRQHNIELGDAVFKLYDLVSVSKVMVSRGYSYPNMITFENVLTEVENHLKINEDKL